MPCLAGTLMLIPLGNFRPTANIPSKMVWACGSWPAIIATIGWILLVIGVVLLILGQVGRPVGGRRYWY